jgi:hypothetical protein
MELIEEVELGCIVHYVEENERLKGTVTDKFDGEVVVTKPTKPEQRKIVEGEDLVEVILRG